MADTPKIHMVVQECRRYKHMDTHRNVRSHYLLPQPTPHQALMFAKSLDVYRNTDVHTHLQREMHALPMLKRYHSRADTGLSDIRPGSATNHLEVSDGGDSNNSNNNNHG